MTTPPPAEGMRIPWQAIPAALRAEVERLLGARVVAAATQRGGFSPGVAARLTLADGSRAFVKAVGDINPESPGIHRAEAQVAAALPASTTVPRFLGSIDADGWVILLFEDIEGRLPHQPWRPDELGRVLAALTDLAAALSPAPIEVPTAPERFRNFGSGWHSLAAAAESDDLADVDPWARGHLGALVELEASFPDAVAGTSLVHGDIRADNILLTDDRVVFVDWPWASLAKPWFDLAALLPSVAMQGGPPPEELFAAHPVAQDADPAHVTAFVATLAGVWAYLCRKPDPPGLPTLRAFQRAQGEVALGWLRTRLGSRAGKVSPTTAGPSRR
jgi:aminoglycoside phosphotransferase